MARNDFPVRNEKSEQNLQKNDQLQALSLREWLVIGVVLGFVLTAVAVALFIHSFAI